MNRETKGTVKKAMAALLFSMLAGLSAASGFGAEIDPSSNLQLDPVRDDDPRNSNRASNDPHNSWGTADSAPESFQGFIVYGMDAAGISPGSAEYAKAMAFVARMNTLTEEAREAQSGVDAAARWIALAEACTGQGSCGGSYTNDESEHHYYASGNQMNQISCSFNTVFQNVQVLSGDNFVCNPSQRNVVCTDGGCLEGPPGRPRAEGGDDGEVITPAAGLFVSYYECFICDSESRAPGVVTA